MKKLRLRRLFGETDRKLLITPMDHGVSLGPIAGIRDMRSAVASLVQARCIDAVVLHKGNIRDCADVLARERSVAVILHLSGSVAFSPNREHKVLVSSVEDALRIGADAVSVHVNVGNPHDAMMLRDLGKVAGACERWGMPLLAMVYPRGAGIDERDPERNQTVARVAMELGADIIKLNYTGSKQTFADVLGGVNVPVLVAGGRFAGDPEKFLTDIRDAIDVGAAGVAVGRNVFQRLENLSFARALDQLINGQVDVAAALDMIRG